MKSRSKSSSTPAAFRIANLILDRVVPWVRPLLLPFDFAYRLADGAAAIYWLGRNEYLKTRLAECGAGVRIHGRLWLTGADGLRIGSNVHINTGAFLRAEGGLTIGDNTHISRNLVVYTINHDYHGERLPYDQNQLTKPVSIGRNVWIGMNVCIVPGVTIGEGAIIGMGTVVARDVPPLTVVGSAPQSVLKERDVEHYARLDELGRYGAMSGYPLTSALPEEEGRD